MGMVSEPFIPTYVDRRSGSQSVLDLCLSCCALLLRGKVECGPDLGSDHVPIVCTFGLELRKAGGSVPHRWLVNRGDWAGWSCEMESASLPVTYPASVDEINNVLCNLIVEISRKYIPQSSGRQKCKQSTPWWDMLCSKNVALRRKARNALARTPDLSHLIAYKRACAVSRYTIMQKKKSSWHSFVNSLLPDISLQRFWRVIKSMSGQAYSPLVVAVGGPEAPIGLKAEFLAEHFVKSLPHFHSPFHTYVRDRVREFSEIPVVESSYNAPIKLHELETCLSLVKNTSLGIDNVTNLFLKRLPATVINHILYLFNASYVLCNVPNSWKIAIVCPIPKPKKDPLTVHAYRPISLLSCVGKLMERIIKVRLEHFLESEKVFTCFQAGFRRGHSTYDSLALLQQSVAGALSSSSFCLIVYLDLKNAYDGVWHDAVLYKLFMLGCDTRTILWIKSYLQNRCLKVRIGNVCSSCKTLHCGLPQGAVLTAQSLVILCNVI